MPGLQCRARCTKAVIAHRAQFGDQSGVAAVDQSAFGRGERLCGVHRKHGRKGPVAAKSHAIGIKIAQRRCRIDNDPRAMVG
jgi:hypothetical protein